MGLNKKSGASFFQMPLHYPRYTKKDYEKMPEWQIDRLLAEYGLPVNGDLEYKREFAMGAFLWGDDSSANNNSYEDDSTNSSSSSSPSYGGFHHGSSSPCSFKKSNIVEFLFRVLGHA